MFLTLLVGIKNTIKLKMFNFLELFDFKEKIQFVTLLILITFASLAELLSLGILIPFFAFFLGDVIEIKILSTLQSFFVNTGISEPEIFLLILIIAGFIIKNLFLSLTTWKLLSFTNVLKIKIGSRLIRNFLYEGYEEHLKKKSSEILNNNITQLNVLTKTIILINRLINEIIILIGLVIVLIFINYKIFLFVTGILITFSSLIYFLMRNSHFRWGIRRFKMERNIFSTLLNSFSAFKDIFIFQKQNFFISYYIQQEKKLGKSIKLGEFFRQINKNMLEMLAIFIFFCLSYYLIKSEFQKSEILFYLGSYVVVVGRLFPSANRILSSIQSLQFNKITIDTILQNFKNVNLNINFDANNKVNIFKDDIIFKNVNFGFEENKDLIRNLNLRIKKQSIFGLFGKTGSGKSTILDLIIGLYEPNTGEILVDKKKINLIKQSWLKNIAYVGQNNFIFDNSIISNITYQFSDNNESTYSKYLFDKSLEYSCSKDFIDKENFNSVNKNIGEKGNQLSGGQLQRIGIARAIYSDRPILIFDEISSALDRDTERKIFENLLKLKNEGKTIIISSHSKSLEKYCDHILNLDEKNN